MDKKHVLKSTLVGSLTGIVNGIFGAGGGLVLVPLLTRFIKLDIKYAMPTSIAIIFPMCMASAFVYMKRGDFDVSTAVPYLLGGLAGGIIGGLTYSYISKKWLRRVLGVLIIYSGVRALFLL